MISCNGTHLPQCLAFLSYIPFQDCVENDVQIRMTGKFMNPLALAMDILSLVEIRIHSYPSPIFFVIFLEYANEVYIQLQALIFFLYFNRWSVTMLLPSIAETYEQIYSHI